MPLLPGVTIGLDKCELEDATNLNCLIIPPFARLTQSLLSPLVEPFLQGRVSRSPHDRQPGLDPSLLWGLSVHREVFSSTLGLYPLDASSSSHPTSCEQSYLHTLLNIRQQENHPGRAPLL